MPNRAGYLQVPVPLASFVPGPRWLVVEETMTAPTPITGLSGIAYLAQSHGVLGTVLKIGASAEKLYDVHEGDTVLYEEWQGGRWSLADPEQPDGQRRVLIMDRTALLAKVYLDHNPITKSQLSARGGLLIGA